MIAFLSTENDPLITPAICAREWRNATCQSAMSFTKSMQQHSQRGNVVSLPRPVNACSGRHAVVDCRRQCGALCRGAVVSSAASGSRWIVHGEACSPSCRRRAVADYHCAPTIVRRLSLPSMTVLSLCCVLPPGGVDSDIPTANRVVRRLTATTLPADDVGRSLPSRLTVPVAAAATSVKPPCNPVCGLGTLKR